MAMNQQSSQDAVFHLRCKLVDEHSAVHMVETHFPLENLWISEPSLGILEKFQRSSALPNIKYNCAVLFWSQLYWRFIYV